MKKHFIFDVDGTLVDSQESVLSSMQEMLKQQTGRWMEREELLFTLGIPGADALRLLHVPEEKIEAAMEQWLGLTPKYRDLIHVFPGIWETLTQLRRRGCHLGIVTSRTRAEYEEDVAHFGLSDWFDTIVCADDTRGHKPQGDPVREYLRRMGADPGEAVYIGDTVYDMQCAADAGVEGALALWGCASARHIRADYYLSQPAAVTETFFMQEDVGGRWLKWAKELQFIAQAGVTYSHDPFDRERFERIRQMAAEMVSGGTGEDFGKVEGLFRQQCGYQTPKLDTRAAVFEEGKILLVQENDGRWALPGGWQDEDQTVYGNTVKEVWEEAGITVAPVRLIALQDHRRRNTPPNLFNICKVFVLCEPVEGEFRENIETLQCGWFGKEELPPLALEKTTKEQIEMCYAAAGDKHWVTLFD